MVDVRIEQSALSVSDHANSTSLLSVIYLLMNNFICVKMVVVVVVVHLD